MFSEKSFWKKKGEKNFKKAFSETSLWENYDFHSEKKILKKV